MVKNDNVRSISGMPDQPADADHVEPGILCLVEALNRAGFRTRASCQGHWHWLFGASNPYVAFTGDTDQASRLSEWLHRHWQRGGLYWELDARFGTDGLLWYRLSPPFRCWHCLLAASAVLAPQLDFLPGVRSRTTRSPFPRCFPRRQKRPSLWRVFGGTSQVVCLTCVRRP